MSRVAYPSPVPAEFEGRRYEELDNGQLLDLEQRTGLLAIVDIASGRRIGLASIYDYPRDEWDEADMGDVFMTSIEVDEATREIVVTNERGDCFACRVDDGAVRQRSTAAGEAVASACRPPPPVVAPLEHGGIRYVADGRPGWLAAFDASSGARLWSAPAVAGGADSVGPVTPERYLRSLTLLPGATGIDVEDEYRVHYAFDFATRTTRRTTPVVAPRVMPNMRPLLVPPKPPGAG